MNLTAEDRMLIVELYSRNCWALDMGDEDAFAATFTQDGSLKMRGRYEGEEALRGFIREFRERDFGFPRAQHLVTGLIIEGNHHRCETRAYVTRVHRLPGQQRGNCHIMWTGYSADICTKIASEWRFESRVLKAWEGDITDGVAHARQRERASR